MPSIKKLKDKRYWMRFIYTSFYNSKPVDKNTILFESFHGKEVSDSPLAMARALFDMPDHGKYKVYFRRIQVVYAVNTKVKHLWLKAISATFDF